MTRSENRIRVFYLITSSNFGGAETLLYEQVFSLDMNFFEPVVCSIKPAGAIAEKIRARGVHVVSLNWDWRKAWMKPWLWPQPLAQLVMLLREFRPHIMHASLFQADVLGSLAGTLAGVPVRLATLHMVLRNRLPELMLERLLSPFIHCYLSVSHNMRDVFVRKFFIAPDKIEVVHNAVSIPEVEKRAQETLPAGRVIDWQRPTFAMIGRIDPQKDLDLLISAMKILSVKKSPAQAILVGEGPDRLRLEKKVRDEGLSDNIHFMGYQGNPMPYLAKSLALVLSSREEGLPLVVLEAMALKKPVISTAVGAVPEAVKNNVTGLLVPHGNPQLLAQAMESLALHPDDAREKGSKGFEAVKAKFTVEVMGLHLSSIYKILSQTQF